MRVDDLLREPERLQSLKDSSHLLQSFAVGFRFRQLRLGRLETVADHLQLLRLQADVHQRSPRSPCPFGALFLAFRRRSWARERPASSDSLNWPVASRRTYRLSVPVLISSRFAFFLGMAILLRAALQPRCR